MPSDWERTKRKRTRRIACAAVLVAALATSACTLGQQQTDVQAGGWTRSELMARMRFHMRPPRFYLAQGIDSVPAPDDMVVLTFDDGPSGNTLKILRILDRFDAHATFFCIGHRSVGKGDVLRAILTQGSEIGNHTYSHLPLAGRSQLWDMSQITQAEEVFADEVSVRPFWVRPQGGWVDQYGIDAIGELDKRYVYWDLAGEDTVREYTSAEIRDRILRYVQPGSVILLHETATESVRALPEILAGLEKKRFIPTSLTRALSD